jgi:hypothetical protein
MANKRIRDLNTTTTFPAGAKIPVDAAGFPEAQAVGSSDLVDAVSLVLAPPLTINDPSAAAANSAAIEAALATIATSGNKKSVLRLPRGLVWLARAINPGGLMATLLTPLASYTQTAVLKQFAADYGRKDSE